MASKRITITDKMETKFKRMLERHLHYLDSQIDRIVGDGEEMGELHWAEHELGQIASATLADINPLLPDPMNELLAKRGRFDAAAKKVAELRVQLAELEEERDMLVKLMEKFYA